MQYHVQKTKHNPPDSYGDCVRTCIACLMDMEPERVPNFFNGGNENAWIDAKEFLRSFGYDLAIIHVTGDRKTFFEYMENINPNIRYILVGDDHAVIAKGGSIEHDPSWTHISVKNPSHICFIVKC